MIKYKQTIMNEETYDLIRKGKQKLFEKFDKPFSIAETISYYMKGSVSLDLVPREVRNYVKEFVSNLGADSRIRAIILFGSYARGEQTKYSDIDLFIVFDGKKIDAFDLVSSTVKSLISFRDNILDSGLYSDISPLIITSTDLKELRPIYFDIVRDGIQLFDRDSTIDEFFTWILKFKVKRRIVASTEVVSWTL